MLFFTRLCRLKANLSKTVHFRIELYRANFERFIIACFPFFENQFSKDLPLLK
jgi:hypothetical protein